MSSLTALTPRLTDNISEGKGAAITLDLSWIANIRTILLVAQYSAELAMFANTRGARTILSLQYTGFVYLPSLPSPWLEATAFPTWFSLESPADLPMRLPPWPT